MARIVFDGIRFQAGLAALDEPISREDAFNPKRIGEIIARQKPNWTPGNTFNNFRAVFAGVKVANERFSGRGSCYIWQADMSAFQQRKIEMICTLSVPIAQQLFQIMQHANTGKINKL